MNHGEWVYIFEDPTGAPSPGGSGRKKAVIMRKIKFGSLYLRQIPSTVKNIAYLVGITLLLGLGTSCKKTYECTCYYDILVEHKLVNVSTDVKEIKAQSENDAQRDCAAHHFSTIDFRGNGTTARCSLN